MMESEFVKKKRIGEIFLEMGVVTDLQLRTGLERQAVVQKRIGEILVENGLITGDDVAYALAKQFGVQYFDVNSLSLEPALMEEFSRELIVQEEFLPIRKVDERLYIVVHDPTDLTVLDQIKTATQLDVRYAVGAKGKIMTMIKQYYSAENTMMYQLASPPVSAPPTVAVSPALEPAAPPSPPAGPVAVPAPPPVAETPPAYEPGPDFFELQKPVPSTESDDIVSDFIAMAKKSEVEITFHMKSGNTVKGIVSSYDSRVVLLIMRQKREIIFWDAIAGATYLLPSV